MKENSKHVAIVVALLFATTTFLSGCATTGMQRSEDTRTTMQTVETDIGQAVTQVNLTAASLEALIDPNQLNAKLAFEKYSGNVDKMESLGKRLIEHTEKMSDQKTEYFKEWQTEGETYTNPEIRSLSEQRRADMRAVFSEISEAKVGVMGSFKAYMSDIRQIETYLSNDLTPKGIESITPVAQNAVTDGQHLKDAVGPILYAIGNARAELAPTGAK